MPRNPSLQLGKIILNNYRTYKGENVIEFSRDPEKTITIIEGEMGKGKTTILNAVYWCLYGEFRPTGNRSDENIINNDVLSSLKLDDDNDTFIEIQMYEEDELRYKIKRNVNFTKKHESSKSVYYPNLNGNLPNGVAVTSTITFSHLPKFKEDWQVFTDPVEARDLILNIFPESLSSYFLFDGELLDTFFDAGSKNNVKNGIEKISGLPILEDSIKHIKTTYEEELRDIVSPKIESIKQDIFFYQGKLTFHQKNVEDTDLQLEEINNEMESIKSYLRNNDEKLVQSNQKRNDELKDEIKRLDNDLNNLQKNIGDWLLYCNTVMRLRSMMEYSLKKCDEWEKEGKIPIAVSGQALNNILRANPSICICGTHLKENSKERAYMKELLTKNTADSPIIQNITTGRGHWDDMVNETKSNDISEKLDQYRAKRSELESERTKKYRIHKQLSRELEKHDQTQIRENAHRLSELENDYNDKNGNKAIAKTEIDKLTLYLEQKNRELDLKTKEESKYQSHFNRRRLAKTIEGILKECRIDLIEQLRKTVAEKTTNYFLRLVSRNDFSYVEINSNYTVTAYASTERSKQLSAGQTCCLALSYIAAIRDIAEKNYFMVIDSPLHNINQSERVGIAKNLPKFIPGTQITLLVQDQEYVGRVTKTKNRSEIPSVREILMKNNSLWKEYMLILNENKVTNSYNTIIREMNVE